MSDTQEKSIQEEDSRYLLFSVGGEMYGTPLLGVREVVEYQQPKSIPNAVEHFMGVINLRGQIVGVIDLRKRLGHQTEKSAHDALIIFDTVGGPLAALVDKVESVTSIRSDHIEKKPNIRTNIPTQFLIGIAQVEGRLVNIIDLNEILGHEEIRTIHSVS
jgi:purine-binding chemotaxis protein CheW